MSSACTDYLEIMSRRLDGEVEETEAARLDAHLASCEACGEAWAEMLEAHGLVREHFLPRRDDEERAALAAERTIARLREEPDPEWSRARRPAARIRPFRRRWSLSWRIGAGLAAVTAAVLLALRVAPGPTAPERIARPAWQAERSEKAAGAATEETLREQPATPTPAPTGAVSEIATVTDADSPTRGPESGANATEALAPSATEASDDLQAGEAPLEPPARALPVTEPEMETESQRIEPPSRIAPQEVVQEKKSELSPPPPEGFLKDKVAVLNEETRTRHVRGGRSDETSFTLQSDGKSSAAPPADTSGSTAGWSERLEVERGALLSELGGIATSDAAARADLADRLRSLGDLWEWLGRRERSPRAFARALDLYERARALDAEAAELDSTRVRRARAGAQPTGNTRPPRR